MELHYKLNEEGNGLIVYGDKTMEGDIHIPPLAVFNQKEYPVTEVGPDAFSTSRITSISIPDSVTKIGEGAFAHCESLKEAVFGHSIKEIPDGCFLKCRKLGKVTIGKSITRIQGAFGGCEALTSINITDLEAWCNIDFRMHPFQFRINNAIAYRNDAQIGHLYLNNVEIKDLIIPETVQSISKYLFYFTDITSVHIPASVTRIEYGAFSFCRNLRDITFGSSKRDSVLKSNLSIGSYAFYWCTKLQSVSISDPESWCNISFENDLSNPLFYANHLLLNGLEVDKLVIPASVSSINDYAFQGCSNLAHIVFSDSLRCIGKYAFKNCWSLKEVILPDSTTDIGAESFMGCRELSNVVVGRSISRIGDHAFYNCPKLTGISHTETIRTTIGKYALYFTPAIHKYVCYHRFHEYRPGDIFEVMDGTPERLPDLPSRHWVELDENNIVYFDIKGDEPLQRLKERLNRNMVPVEGFDYPFSICRCKFSQEDYAVVMGVDHFYNAEEPLGADCPYVTEEWNVWSAYHSSQNWGEIRELLELLEQKTGRHFRLPTIKECEFINTHKEELGFQLKDELCMASSYYLCTESGNYHVSSAMEGLDYPAFYSFRLVECETPLSSIHFTDKQIVDRIEKDLSDDSDDMHYYWEN